MQIHTLLNKLLIYVILMMVSVTFSQEDRRIAQVRNNIESILPDTPGLSEKVNVNIKQAPLSDFLLAVSEVHKVNINIDPALRQIPIVNNFTNVTVADLLVFLCKEFTLTIEFTGNILSVKPYQRPKEIPEIKVIDVDYDPSADLLSLNLKDDKLYDAFKRIMDASGKNLVFAPGMENMPVTAYIRDMPFDAAISKFAYANDLVVSKSRDNFYLFDRLERTSGQAGSETSTAGKQARPQRPRLSNFFFNVLDKERQLLEVDFEDTPIASIIYDIGGELGIDMFIASPLESAGNATVRAKNITFDELLVKLFLAADQPGKPAPAQQFSDARMGGAVPLATATESYTFMKNDNIYYFGTKSQLTVRTVKSIMMMHRSIELLGDPDISQRSSGRTVNPTINAFGNQFDSRNSAAQQQQQPQNSSRESTPSESILAIIPDEVKLGLDIKIDKELNSFLVNGPSENVKRFESFIKYIDKPVPVILIEVMLLEINRSAIIETGISAGIGDQPVRTQGSVFPGPDITLGAQSINKIINRFDGFGSLNIGNVLPDFYVNLKAMEANGDLKIRSSPRLSTLNGHKANLSIGETTYYVVTNQNFYGSQIPQASEIKNYQPIDAELSVSIRPMVSGDGQITLDIRVIQSSFNGERIDEDAPPGMNSREFTSIIRVRDQDLVVLGGLEEKVKNDSGSGLPLLARVPVIKWLFSSRKREDSRKKLTVLIKPTVIY